MDQIMLKCDLKSGNIVTEQAKNCSFTKCLVVIKGNEDLNKAKLPSTANCIFDKDCMMIFFDGEQETLKQISENIISPTIGEKAAMILKFKRDFYKEITEDEHICPEAMLKWLEENC